MRTSTLPTRKAAHDWGWLLDFLPDLSEDQDAIIAELTQAFIDAYSASANDAAIDTTVRDAAAKFARARAGELITDIAEATRDRVRELVGDAIDAGQSVDWLRQQLRADGAFGKERAQTIARTETANCIGIGQRAAAVDMGQDEKQWRPGNCDYCLANAEDGWIGIDDTFSTGDDTIPAHPNCLPGHSLVAPIGDVAASSDRWYEGDLVILRTAGGKHLSCTPGHPILTPNGWIGAGLLNVGNYVISTRGGEWIAARNDKREDVPTSIEDIAKATGASFGGTSTPMPVTAPDFHGDGGGSQVTVIRTNGLLRDGNDTAFTEQRVQEAFGFTHTDAALLASRRTTLEHVDRVALSTSGLLGLSGLAKTLILCAMEPAHAIRLPSFAQLDARFSQPASDSMAGDPIFLRQRKERGTSGVFLDEISEIRRIPFSGHVYNLQTTSGMYIAEGIITHNCTCTVIYRTKHVHEAAPVAVVKEARCPQCHRWVGRNIPIGSECYCPQHKAVTITQ